MKEAREMAESLNDAWEEFVRINEAFYAEGEGEGVGGPFELTADFALRVAGGKEVVGTLCICYFDNTKERQGTEEGGHIGIQFDLNDHMESGQFGEGLFDFISNSPGALWTKDLIVEVFNVDPDSPIWERAEV